VKLKWKAVFVLKTLVSVVLLTLVLTRVDLSKALAGLNDISFSFIVFALALYTGCQWLSCLRWQVILRATGYHVGLVALLRSYFAGMFLNVFLPGALGGDVYRIYRLGRQTGDAEASLVSVFLERFTGLGALTLLALLGLPVSFGLLGSWDIQLLFMACLAVLVAGVLLMANRTLFSLAEPWLCRLCLSGLVARLARIQDLLRVFTRRRWALFQSVGISLGLQLAIVTYHYLIARQLHIAISFLEMLVFIPIVAVITLLPVSLGGLGVKEGLWVLLFSRSGLTVEQALLLSVTLTGLSWLLALPGGGVLLLDAVRGRGGASQPARRSEAMRAA
jgi:uncharacterized protein (TIRG00374 family)